MLSAIAAVLLTACNLGSFLNVCIYRIPRKESIAYPPSHCPSCGQRLRPLELIPVVSFLWQRGRCRHCGVRISWRYPLVELLTAVLLLTVYLLHGNSWASVHWGVFTALLIVISFIDLDTQLIPSELVYIGMAWAGAYNLLVQPMPLFEWLLGGLLGFGLFYAIYYFSNGGMGGGDVRLAGMLGLFLGWRLLLLALLWSFVGGALVSLLLLASGRVTRKDAIPFGPFMAVGGWAAAIWGERFLTWYLSLFF